MASPLQQQSVRRKLVYTGLILVLFSVTAFGWRGMEFRNAVPPAWTVAGQANALGIRQRSHGDVELSGSAIRLGLTGSRGLVVCYLWNRAMDKQKRHEWNELSLLVRSLTKLQPHFITPWLFQSWNLSYNVSVESDLLKDRYYYMAEGIKLLAEGERQNQNHPDLRHSMGFYYQHKIGLNDQANTIRSLFQLSCTDPREWDPNYLRPPRSSGRPVVDLERFEQFCQKHPMLVRRLREGLRMETPDEVVDFLQSHRKIPSRYEETAAAEGIEGAGTNLKTALEQFPVLPLKFDAEVVSEYDPADPVPDEYENFSVARAWFAYALKPLPPASDKPALSHPPFDRSKYRLPRYMAHEIFRGYSARGQTYVAENYEREGWFDRDGWLVRGWFKDDKGAPRDARVGTGVAWGRDSWDKAFQLWQQHGTKTGLYKTAEQLKDLDDQAAVYRKLFDVQPELRGAEPPEGKRTPEVMAGYDAHDQLYWYDRNRSMTNFPHFYFKSQVEALDETVAARKDLFEAEQLRKLAKNPQALAAYERGTRAWRKLLLDHRDFAADSNVQEESYETQLRYVNLLQEMVGRRVRPVLEWQDLLTQATALASVPQVGLVPWLPSRFTREHADVPFVGPFDGTDSRGFPLIEPDIRFRVRSRMGLIDMTPTVPPSTAPELGTGPAPTSLLGPDAKAK